MKTRIIVLVAASALSVTSAFCQIQFEPHTITTTADGARSVFAIDVDGDGDVDVLSASAVDNTIAWYENDGLQNFTAHVITNTALDAWSVFAIDVDGDDDIDVLSASGGDNKIAWYENDGLENFTTHVITTGAVYAHSVFAIDLDGDTDIDVLSASRDDNTIAWYENDGLENFTTHAITTGANGALSVFAIDVDGDDDIDVLSASRYNNTIAWYENDGSENFSTHVITSSAIYAKSVFAIDVDGDADIDVLSASLGDNTIAWYENDGSENFSTHVITSSALEAWCVYATDLDGDDDIDVLSASGVDDKIAWYENDGSENFSTHVITTSATEARSVFAIDVDGDADIDVLSASIGDDKIAWYESTGLEPFRVVSPNGGQQWPVFSTQTVTWASDSVDGLIRIELNRDYPNGNWEILADNTADDNEESVTVTGPFSNACRVRISLVGDTLSDVSNGNFSIVNPLQITSPNGNEQWPLYSTQTITWVSDNVDGLIRLEINRDYPNVSWVILVDSTADDNSEDVFVNGGTSGNCRVRISLIGDTLSDVSNGNFSITTSQGTLRLVRDTYPNAPVNFWFAGALEEPDTISETFRLKNFGSQNIVVFPPLEPVTEEFSIVTTCDTIILQPGLMSGCELTLRYHPQESGQDYDTLLIQTNASNGDANGYVRIPLEGEAILSADENAGLPKEFALHPVYPNPFNATATIRYDVPTASHVRLKLYDVLGKEVAVLVDEGVPAGTYRATFDGSDLPSGIYFAQLDTGDFLKTVKLMLLK